MADYKIGDAVRRVDTWDLSVGLPVGEVGVVSVLHGNDLVEIKGYSDWLHTTESLELVEQVDDELPPVPESGLYFNHNGTRSASLKLAEGSIALGTNASILKVRLTPETALDLAYDLRRMAMEIKRKERNG